ncbi:hypothetical protein HB780_06180 (plasmid) [Rhizobium lusitanum]|uniref:hypothetical protein n=1 Tax=Rhizobium lusitanum TaxID=293958 RepID=UPI00161B2158|nr:hypothetical protein [Rhizobium lusitanum]QND45334.1 hypothetical protein HB780_06180 [Rhizobium lusitanum]
MQMFLDLTVVNVKPQRRGNRYFWKVILEATADGNDRFAVRDILDKCDRDQRKTLIVFLQLLAKAGYAEEVPSEKDRYFRLLRRQSDCPSLTRDGKESSHGKCQQQMWNVMRRERGGFTVADLAIAASTDDIGVNRHTAGLYCRVLHRCGVLALRKDEDGQNYYVLKGSANTGPKAPRRMAATVIYDPNREQIIGDVVAEEVLS